MPPLPARAPRGPSAVGAPRPAEAAAGKRFFAIVDRVRQRGLSAEVEQLEPLLDVVHDARLRGEIARLLGFYWLRQGRHDKALQFSDEAARHLPDHTDCTYNAFYACFAMGRFDEAVQRGRRALERHGESFLWHNLLSTALGAAGRVAEGRVHGTRSLELKDALTRGQPGRDLSDCALPPFDAKRPAQQVISFSLFGQQAKYLDGAVHNATAARYVYPGWTCRFHVDASVPETVVQALEAQGAQIRRCDAWPAVTWGTLWRFQVADDPTVARYLVRDADSLINLREAVAVQEWLVCDRHFHGMRDHFDHSELVLAGMWGGVRGAMPPIEPAARAFLGRGGKVQNRTADQEFLREVLWPTIRRSVLVHDSQFAFGERHDFPPHARLPEGCHVGGDARRLLGSAPPPPSG